MQSRVSHFKKVTESIRIPNSRHPEPRRTAAAAFAAAPLKSAHESREGILPLFSGSINLAIASPDLRQVRMGILQGYKLLMDRLDDFA